MKAFARRCHAAANRSCASAMIEGLETRRMLSAAPEAQITPLAAVPQIKVMPAASAKIMAGKTRHETVTIQNTAAASETEVVTITLAPSIDGTTACGSYSTPSMTRTLTIEGHSRASVRVPFVAPVTLAAGSYRTLATVQVGAETLTAAAPRMYTLTLPAVAVSTPDLVGDYAGLITGTHFSRGNLFADTATFSWETTDQTTSGMSGLFSVGTGQSAGTMNGSELSNGRIHFTLKSDDINYVVTGKVMHNGAMIKGHFSGKLTDNIFPAIDGQFRIFRQGT